MNRAQAIINELNPLRNAEYEYWGDAGAGMLVKAKDTGRYLLAFRSLAVNEPHTWGIISGAVDPGETAQEAALRELEEETHYRGRILRIRPSYVFERPNFTFYNFIAEVPKEFEAVPNWESEYFQWFTRDEFPEPLHFGLKELLKNDRRL